MYGFFRLNILGLMLGLAPLAFATDHDQNCKQSGDQKTQECNAAGSAAEAANTSQAGAVGKSMPGSQINIGAQGQKQSALDSANRLNDAKNQCAEKKQECESKCDNEAQQADSDAAQAQAQDPMHQCNAQCMNYKQQASKIRSSTKNNSCSAPIAAAMGKLGDGANAAQQAANDAGKTDGKSAGMPPIPPIPPPSSSPSPTPTPKPPTTTDQMACSTDPNAATLSQCAQTMVQKCTPGLASNATTDPSCDTFTMRYCNAAPTSTSAPAASTASTDTGVAGFTTGAPTRPGTGVGSSYCNTAIAKDFCQNTAHAQCATCQNYRSTTSDACKADPTQCRGTMFGASCPDVEPPIAATPPSGTSPSTGSGGGDLMSGSGGGGGSFSGTTAPAQAASKEGKPAGSDSGLKLDMATGEGGGGGGGGFGSSGLNGSDDFLSKYRPKASPLTAASAPPAASRTPASTEVAAGAGASLFGIQSATIKRMCDGNRLRHCGRIN